MIAISIEQWRIQEIIIGQRKRKRLGDIGRLAANIERRGLLQPIVAHPDRRLIAGYRRLLACQELGWATVPVRVLALDNLLDGEVDENVMREDFAISDLVDIAAVLRPMEEAAAKERQRTLNNASVDSTEAQQAGAARDIVARRVGLGWQALERAEEIVAAARAEPERFGHLVEVMDRTGKVNGVYKRLIVMQKADAIRAEPPVLPGGRYRVIVADPPWRYREGPEPVSRRVSLPYPSMSLEEIAALPVRQAAHDHALLWLWTTNTHMRAAFDIAASWGFEHRTILTWVKDRMGTGDWLRAQTEHCLLAVRGRPTVLLTNQTTALLAPAGDHSGKPDAFYALVEAMCPGAKIEFFARRPREGWAAFGDEATWERGDATTK